MKTNVSTSAGKPTPMDSAKIDMPENPTDTGSTCITLEGFNSWYADFQALHGIQLEIPERKVTAFIGPSGCGKSTLLRWFNRMNDTISTARCEGHLELLGQNILDPRFDVGAGGGDAGPDVAVRLNIGMVFQKPNPFPKSIFDNIAYGPRLHRKYSKSDLANLVEFSLRQAAIWDEVKDRLKDSALGLSGGQQQRLCIARAIAVGPDVLLMDEPCSALDPRSSASIEELIRTLRDQYTIVIVTHNMQQAARVSDQTAFFYNGVLVESNDTDVIFTKPQKQETEDYVSGRFG